MKIEPLKKFEIIDLFGVGFLQEQRIEFTNSSLMMLFSFNICFIFFYFSLKRERLIPSRLQVVAELFFRVVDDLFEGIDPFVRKKFFPLIFTMFFFILSLNLLGNIPYFFSVTSQIIVNICISLLFFLLMTITAIKRNLGGFVRIFIPKDISILLLPLIFVIELFSYLSKPLVLCLRLTVNIVAGHIMLEMVASIIGFLAVYFRVLLLPLLSILSCFEIVVSILQAYIFVMLSCTYLRDAFSHH